MRWLDVKGSDGNLVSLNLDNIQGTLITEGEIQTKPKSEVIGSKATIEKKWFVNMIMSKDFTLAKMFNSKEEAEKWQKDYVLNV
jgi:hypothetical protein